MGILASIIPVRKDKNAMLISWPIFGGGRFACVYKYDSMDALIVSCMCAGGNGIISTKYTLCSQVQLSLWDY